MTDSTGQPPTGGAQSPESDRFSGANAPPPPPEASGPTPWRPWHQEDLAWAAGAHLGGVVLSFVAPLAVYLLKRKDSGFLRDQAAEAVNFQLTLLLTPFGLFLLVPLLAQVAPPLVTIAFVVLIFLVVLATMIYNPVQAISAALSAGRGTAYRYPWAIRVLK